MNITKAQYDKMAKKASPNSKTGVNCIKAFVFGGGICVVGQILFTLYSKLDVDETMARTLTSVTLVFIGALLTALGVYDKIAKHAGAGTIIPITGFANSVASPAIEFKSEGIITGMAAKMFVIAGPVIVFSIVSSVAYGIVYFAYTTFFA